MEYRELNEEYQPSLLGFGCMRFPLDAQGKIDEAEAERMLDTAIAHGVKYIDTAFPYHHGDSEPFVGRVLKKYDRSSYYLTTKLPLWDLNTLEDAKAMFENQLKRLDVTYVDFYLLHAVDKAKWEKAKQLGILAYCEELKAQGKIRNFGFSFHDEYDVFEEILTYRKWDFCQIQYNYVDTQEQAGDRGYALAEKLGIPMVIMEPVKGGSLSKLPQDLASRLKEAAPNSSISSWLIKEIAEEIKARTMNGCTGCAYCMPCPFGLDIPKNFRIWNEHAKYGNTVVARKRYFEEMKEEERSSQCKKCGKCEALCPQHIAIREDLAHMSSDMELLKSKAG